MLTALTASLVSLAPAASASVAETLFDKYSVNNPGTRNTNRGTVFYGGSFNARIDQNPTELVGFQAPSISGGCGGIDMFAGSFSLVSKDEVVQMLRGSLRVYRPISLILRLVMFALTVLKLPQSLKTV